MEIRPEGPKTVRIPDKYIQEYDPSIEKHIYCSSCRAPLFDIIPNYETEKITKITANCPHCGDKSFQTKVLGEFFFGNTDYTVHHDIDFIKVELDKSKKVTYCEAIVYTRKVKEWQN